MSNGGTIQFAQNSLPNAVLATVREAVDDLGRVRTQISFNEDVRGRNIEITFTKPSAIEPATSSLLLQNTSVVQSSLFDAATMVTPYPDVNDRTNLGYVWRIQPAGFLDLGDHRIPFDTPIKIDKMFVDEVVAVGADGKTLEYYVTDASKLYSVLPKPDQPIDVGNFEPVLFVHGFAQGTAVLGGGKDTWGNFPKLVKDLHGMGGKPFIPFEFRWVTDARFADAAGDLVQAIGLIKRKTGKPVHIVAHSFGGVIARTVLQQLAEGVNATDIAEARASVQTLLTLGTPHSGIARTNNFAVPEHDATPLPNGQDAASFHLCDQISCLDMGEPLSSSYATTLNSILKLPPASAGYHTTKLAETIGVLPNIPVVVGIGLTRDRGLGNGDWDDGDYLIRYGGQRLLPSDTVAGTAAGIALRKGVPDIGSSARVYEVVLGTDRDIRPGDPLSVTELSRTVRKLGYLHSVETGLTNTCNVWAAVFTLGVAAGGCEQDGVNFGIEANPTYECGDAATCQHDGWLLFKNLQLGRFCEFTAAGCGTPVFDVIATFTAFKDVETTFTVTGQSLAPGYVFAFPGCVATEVSSTSTTARQYVCTPTQAGVLAGSLTFQGNALKTFNVTVTSSPSATVNINDTGILFGGIYPAGNNGTCTGESVTQQDCSQGRDANSPVKVGGGGAGFDFTKISNSGAALPESAALGTGTNEWACTRDNVTGLIWEVKTTSGLRDRNHTYSWYSTDSTNNGGSVGAPSGAACETPGRCDTEKFVQDVNTSALCGKADWRMPKIQELHGIVNFGGNDPAIDPTYFPYTIPANYWTGTAFASDASRAWYVHFYGVGGDYHNPRSNGYNVRLVRSGP